VKSLLARHAPDSLVCFGGAGTRTAAQFATYARTIAAALPHAAPGSPRTRVVLACNDRYRFSAALAATWLRGLTAELPVNGQPAIVHALARGSSVLALLHDRDEDVGTDVRPLEPLVDERHPRSQLPLELLLADGAPAAIAYTSGSTGAPTPHLKTLAQLLREPEAHIVAFDLAARRIVSAVPPYHIYGLLFGVLVPLLGGGSMSRNAPLQPAELLHELTSAQADVLISVPPQLAALAAYETDAWPAMARVFSSAAPLPPGVSKTLAERGWRVTEVLGSTETGGIAHRSDSGAVWEGLPSVKYQVDADSALWVDSPWLAPDVPRPLCTADRVELDEGGFRHLGRSDAVVKVGGRRIDLGELETRLKECAGVHDARVLAVESRGVRGVELLAVLEGTHIELGALRSELCKHIDPVAVPRRFRVVDKLPRSETGKLARSDLLALFDVWRFPSEALPDGRVRFAIPHELGYFRGHFDEVPILAGVVQLEQLVLRETRRRFPELRVLSRLSRVKFKRLNSPGEVMDLTLERRSDLTVLFTLEVAGHPAASGMLSFLPPAPDHETSSAREGDEERR
jgi:acyl-coenzyme A synthetase/AMP-(fatty) acid ligase